MRNDVGSARHTDGSTPNSRRNARVNASWLAKPLSSAMSSRMRSVAIMRYAARSRRMRPRNRAGDSPATARATRSNCERDSPARPAIASAVAGIASTSTATRSTNAVKWSAAVAIRTVVGADPRDAGAGRG